jgi:hypothetical protein
MVFMNNRILDLDGSVACQVPHTKMLGTPVTPAIPWGPAIRLACSFRRFRQFERHLAGEWGDSDTTAQVTFVGSGDFHHVSLALVRRVPTPCNLLVIDNHPDWMRGVPFLHCGTWLYHAARLPGVNKIFHVGGDVDFDNFYQPMAPWPFLKTGKIVTIPAVRSFQRGRWASVGNQPLLPKAESRVTADRMDELLCDHAAELGKYPLYISLDKDVMKAEEAIVNWDSGHLRLGDVLQVLRSFMAAANHLSAGIDIVGDWSPVKRRGWLRHLMHFTMHPPLAIDSRLAAELNAKTNIAILDCITRVTTGAKRALAS